MASGRGCDEMRVGLESAEVHSLAKLRNCLSKGRHGPSRAGLEARQVQDDDWSARIESTECRYQSTLSTHHQTTDTLNTHTMATAFRAMRLAQRAPISRQMPVSRIASALPRTYATATIREATPNKPADQVEQASEDLSGEDVNMNGHYPDPSKTSALPLKRQFRDPHAEWWDPQERRNYGEPVHEVRMSGRRNFGRTMAD
jgi:hypothetical protein